MHNTNKSVKKHVPLLQSVRTLDQLRERIRYLRCSLRMEDAYVYRTPTLVRFHDLRQPAEMGKAEVCPEGVSIN